MGVAWASEVLPERVFCCMAFHAFQSPPFRQKQKQKDPEDA